ncbi:MAG: hypothetical protein VKJ46_15765, partial [Leptolyngbyaceae bacterium]|nr:hypothetical protein [Leptolyngbyaceae bacterium]
TQAYDIYGKMNAYDRMAQIYLAQKNQPRAIAALKQGLALAKQLRYREDYFAKQIEQVSQSQPQ